MHVYGLSREAAGAVLSMIAFGHDGRQPAAGVRLRPRFKKPQKTFYRLQYISRFGNGSALLFSQPPAAAHALCGVFCIAVCASSIVMIGFTATKELFPVEITGTSVGTVNLFPFLGGAVCMPFWGKVLDAYPREASGAYALEGYTTMLLVLLISTVIALGCTLMRKETFPG